MLVATAFEVLLVVLGSAVPDPTLAVLETLPTAAAVATRVTGWARSVPAGVDDAGLPTKPSVVLAPDANEATGHVRSPAPPAGGEAQPVPELSRTNVVPAGTLSLTTVLVAMLGPPLVAVIV